ncbi:MAG: FAD-dependent oxidoreductase [Steroidobacteraceae bacterium]
MSRGEVIVVGGGLAGLCSAAALSEAGYAVHVLERREGVGLETSFANGGLITPSMPQPWSSPGVWRLLLKWLGREDAPMLLRPAAMGSYLGWGLRFLSASSPREYRAATAANFRLCDYSLRCLQRWRRDLSLEYAAGTRGILNVFRDRVEFGHGLAGVEALKPLGLTYAVLDATAVVRLEPMLAEVRDTIVGAIHYPSDETGNAYLFCQALRERMLERGVRLSNDTTVRGLRISAGRITGVETAGGLLPASQVVVAAGPWSTALLAARGVRLHVRPVKGYSLSIPGIAPALMPKLAVTDDSLHAVMTPLGETLRLAGTAEFSGWDWTIGARRLELLWKLLAVLAPTLAGRVDRSSARGWCGLRPMSADGRPYIGASAIEGLWVNAGHGHLGWSQAAGSACLLAQLMSGAPAAVDPGPYSPQPARRAQAHLADARAAARVEQPS